MIGQSAKGNGSLLNEERSYATEARDAGAREASVTEGDDTEVSDDSDDEDFSAVDEVVELWVQQAKDTFRKLGNWPGRNSGFKAEHPASTYDLLAYAKRAPMAGGVPALRGLQRVHCFLVAIPASWSLYALAWILQRPLRSVCFLIFVVIMWRLH
ncbi:MAG: hypothetical protein JWO67_3154 [Streptosporangiaceae bacterium]|nr:hypothetical protein [Streptosporangiaceae bacterium]